MYLKHHSPLIHFWSWLNAQIIWLKNSIDFSVLVCLCVNLF